MTYPTKVEIDGALRAFALRKVSNLNRPLLKDQVNGVHRLIQLGRKDGSTLFYGDTGVGKTIQAIVASAFLAAEGNRRVLILAPSTAVLRERWKEDLDEFQKAIREANELPNPPSWASKLSTLQTVRADVKSLPTTTASSPQIWLGTTPTMANVTKGATRNPLGHRKRWIEKLHPCLVVIDEAHMRTGEDTSTRDTMETLLKGLRLLSLTATPVSQHAKSLQQIVNLNGGGKWAEDVTEYQVEVHHAVRTWWASGGQTEITKPKVDRAVRSKGPATAAFKENVVRQKPRATKQTEPKKIRVQVEEDGDWIKGYGLARILPALLVADERVEGRDRETSVSPSDAYRRMLLSSPAAFWSSAVAKTLLRKTMPEWKTIQKDMGALLGAHGSKVLGAEQLKHPKIRWTVTNGLKQAQGRQVLIFVQYLETIKALVSAIKFEAEYLGSSVTVGSASDKGDVARFRNESKGGILVASPRHSMGLEFDRNHPNGEKNRLLICHDLPWSAVMLQQQVGRLRRASNGFPEIDAKAPILEIPDDLRVHATVMGRWNVAEIVDIQGGFAGGSDDAGVQGLPDSFPAEFVDRLRLQ